jgi:excisionase family DNA binding protein
MPNASSVPQTQVRSEMAPVPYFASQPAQDPTTTQTSEAQRFFERHRAQALGYELPLNTREAAAYVGLHPKTVERMAREGTIPAHPVSGVRRKTWRFYASELDAWLHDRVDSPRRPCSPNGKDRIN